MDPTPGKRFGRYEILSRIGAGGMGEVWRARDTKLDREVALKFLPASLAQDPERLARFEREAKVLASLNHPNIAAIYGLEESEGARFLAMELVPGEDLAERLARGRMPVDEAVAVARQIAEAVEAAHEQGVVHRDLKPANVKTTPDGKVKVLDFGLAKALDPAISSGAGRVDTGMSPTVTSLGTVAGVIIGTAAYMSPEQARGKSADKRADIWSFGVVLWEMLSGRRMFEGETVSDTLASVLRDAIAWDAIPPSVPGPVVRLLRRCLERDPRKRLRDIGEARIALESLGAEPEAAPLAAPAARPGRVLAAVPWALLAVAVVLGAVAWTRGSKGPPVDAPVLRFEIGLDAKMSGLTWPRVSPDGKMIAFIARGESGRSSIWIRPLDSFSAYPLPGTEGARRPWWSPDSRFVAFFLGNQLKKAPAGGGPAQLIGEADGGADGSWSTDGTILFDGRAIDPIRRIASSGGVASQATRPDASKGEVGHSWPFFLPDGKHFLFLNMPRTAGQKAEIHVAALGEDRSKALVPADSRVEYANGYLVYVLQGTLVAHRFDPDRLEVSGDPIPIAERVGTDINAASSFSVSSSGTLVYLTGTAETSSELIWVDRTGKVVGKVGGPGPYRDLALSPDGTRLAYGFGDERNGGDDIWVRDLKRDVASRLTFDARDDMWPVWSPDGVRVVFSSNRGGHYGLVVKDASGTGTDRPLFGRDDVELGPTDWARDGRTIAMSGLPAARRWNIQMLDVRGEPRGTDYLVSADASQRDAAFSPDGRYVAYTSNETGVPEVYVQTWPASGGKWQISNGGGTQPRWRADGKELFFRSPGDEFFAVPVSLGAGFEPGIPHLLFKRRLDASGIIRNRWTVSADGERFLLAAALENTASPPFSVVTNWPRTIAAK